MEIGRVTLRNDRKRLRFHWRVRARKEKISTPLSRKQHASRVAEECRSARARDRQKMLLLRDVTKIRVDRSLGKRSRLAAAKFVEFQRKRKNTRERIACLADDANKQGSRNRPATDFTRPAVFVRDNTTIGAFLSGNRRASSLKLHRLLRKRT